MNTIKLLTVAVFSAVALAGASPCRAQVFRYNIHIDPITSGLISAQHAMLDGIYTKRIASQEALLVEEALIHSTLSNIHNLQVKTVDYLSNAQEAVRKLNQIAEISRLALDYIPDNALGLVNDIRNHPHKEQLVGINAQLMQQIIAEAAELTPLIASLVTSEVAAKKGDGTYDTESQVNLLNGKERLEVANTILNRLRMLNGSLMSMRRRVHAANIAIVWRDVESTPHIGTNEAMAGKAGSSFPRLDVTK